MKKSFLLILLGFAAISAVAQNDETESLLTDRPGAGDSSNLMPQGMLQIETGGFYIENGDGIFKIKETTYNTTLLRYGLLENLELRLALDYRQMRFEFQGKELEDKLSGTSPLILGAKVGIIGEKGWIPQIALIGNLTLPYAASADYKPENTGMDFRFAFDHGLSDRAGLSYNLGAQLEPENPELIYVYAISYNYSLSDKIGFFVEVYGDLPEDSSANHLWDTGFTYIATNDLQFDVSGGTAFTEGQNLFLGAGLSYRFGKL